MRRLRQGAGVIALLVNLAACGRIGFDDGTTDTGVAVEGCGLRDLAVGGHSSCAIDGRGALWCWGTLGKDSLPTAIPLPGPARKVVIGHDHACALLDSGKLRCLGAGDAGQLGDGTGVSSDEPIAPLGDQTYVDVAALHSATCAVTANGALQCWGERRAGLDADGAALAPTPVAIAGASDFRRVLAAKNGACADTPSKRFCWGQVALANGIYTQDPIEVPYLGAISLAGRTACILEDGSVRCVGNADNGMLGDGRTTGSEYENPVTILTGMYAIAGAPRVHCAVSTEGELWCWGENRSGELGTGTLSFETVPTRIDVPPVARVATAFSHTCAETRDGVYCWGGDTSGQLGRGETGIVVEGRLIAGLPPAIAEARVVSRTAGGCARTVGGDVWCWGQGSSGLTGAASRATSVSASRIALPFAADELAIGSAFACARSASAVACWGSNTYGQLGASSAGEVESTPVLVEGLPPAAVLSSLTSGVYGMCVLANAAPYCWGSLKDADGNKIRTLATPIAGAPSAVDISFRPGGVNEHQCLVDTSGQAWCWGSNAYGELGRGAIGASDPTPMPVMNGRTYTAIATLPGYEARTCAIPAGGIPELDCWGSINGTDVVVPTSRPLSAVPVALEAGGSMMCALFADGTRDCAGGGYHGQLGDGTTDSPATFTRIAVPATALSLAGYNACFVEAGQVRCVGEQRHGALGGAPPSALPVRVDLSCR